MESDFSFRKRDALALKPPGRHIGMLRHTHLLFLLPPAVIVFPRLSHFCLLLRDPPILLITPLHSRDFIELPKFLVLLGRRKGCSGHGSSHAFPKVGSPAVPHPPQLEILLPTCFRAFVFFFNGFFALVFNPPPIFRLPY